ncbi:MAG: biotin/lipoyl-containing protein [Bacteroidota bacterium]
MTTFYMENSFTVNVNGNLDFSLSKDQVDGLDIFQTGIGTFHLLKDGVSYRIEILEVDFQNRSYTIRINGNEYGTIVGTPLDQLIKDMGFAVNGSKNIDSISAPMPGLILEISAKIGEEVVEDQQLIILEAMKMENIITSPRKGTIKNVAVKQGDVVDKAQLLIEFE